jgi:hypothetical protein
VGEVFTPREVKVSTRFCLEYVENLKSVDFGMYFAKKRTIIPYLQQTER